MCESLVIAAERYLVAHNIHIIRLVLNPTSAEDAGVIQFSPVYLVSACTFFFFILGLSFLSLSGCYQQSYSRILESKSSAKAEVKRKRGLLSV